MRFTKTLVTITICLVLLSFVSIAAAFKIVEIRPIHGGYEHYNYFGMYHEAYVRTDEDLSYVDWYINDVPVYTSMVNANTNYAIFYNVFGGGAYTLNESIRGETNTIKAVAWQYDDEANLHRATASYDVTVYTPITDEGTRSGVSGKSILYRQYYDGVYITIDCSIYASNGSAIDRKAHGKFRHTIKGKPPVEKFQLEEPLLKNNHIYGPKSDSLRIFVGKIGKDATYDSNAYVRLVVDGIAEDWFVENDEIFTHEDNR